MDPLKISNVVLRTLERQDLELVREWRNSPEVSANMYSSPTISPDEQVAWFEAVREDPSKKYWMILADEIPLGVANLADITPEHSRANWGFYLGLASQRGRGIGSKVEFLVLDYVFGVLGLQKLCGEVFAFNTQVLKLHAKFGFQVEGTRRRHFLKNGAYQDIVEIALFQETWAALREELKERCSRF